jgi:hypothetical protein
VRSFALIICSSEPPAGGCARTQAVDTEAAYRRSGLVTKRCTIGWSLACSNCRTPPGACRAYAADLGDHDPPFSQPRGSRTDAAKVGRECRRAVGNLPEGKAPHSQVASRQADHRALRESDRASTSILTLRGPSAALAPAQPRWRTPTPLVCRPAQDTGSHRESGQCYVRQRADQSTAATVTRVSRMRGTLPIRAGLTLILSYPMRAMVPASLCPS